MSTSPADVATIRANLDAVRRRVAAAATRAHREPTSVRIVAVTKTFPAAVVRAAYQAGLREFGENRVQEALPKIAELRATGVEATWHMVGHLQTNKVKAVLEAFAIIQSVDSLRLAEALSTRAQGMIPVFLEVNVAHEATKYGFLPEETPRVAQEVARLPNLHVRGLMTVAPLVPDPEIVRPVFRQLGRLAAALGLQELSMGMSDDFEVAVEEGATCIRLGRALFGPRSA